MQLASQFVKWGRMAVHRKHSKVAATLYRTALHLDRHNPAAKRGLAIEKRRRQDTLRTVRGVIIGTMGRCNASCVHCPTGKTETAANPKHPMPMSIFKRIIDGIADDEMELTGQITFGLFGDALLDPFVVERARYVMRRLPDAKISINTNGAGFHKERHVALRPLIDVLALHCEAIDPEVYDRLMTPLRARNVFPKIRDILSQFPGKVLVSVPVSKANVASLEGILEWFMARGARNVSFDGLSSRCARDRSIFESLALSPVAGQCGPDLLDYLVVDCDGTVLACCNDFAREEPIGDLARTRLSDTLASDERARFRDAMATRLHADVSTCSRCYADMPRSVTRECQDLSSRR